MIMCGTLCNENTADLIVQAGLVESLFQLMSDKKEDDEMVLQISYTFYQLLLQEPTREALLRYTQVRQWNRPAAAGRVDSTQLGATRPARPGLPSSIAA